MKYFYVWAGTGHAHEVERSFKRYLPIIQSSIAIKILTSC
jgi:hypothetical protein